MRPEYLLDTTVLIELLRGRGAEARERLSKEAARLAVSSVSVFELEFGSARSASPDRNRVAVDELLSRVQVIDLTSAAAVEAGRIRAQLAANGTPIGPFDTLIAGTAKAFALTVVTDNLDEFEGFRGLAVERWF